MGREKRRWCSLISKPNTLSPMSSPRKRKSRDCHCYSLKTSRPRISTPRCVEVPRPIMTPNCKRTKIEVARIQIVPVNPIWFKRILGCSSRNLSSCRTKTKKDNFSLFGWPKKNLAQVFFHMKGFSLSTVKRNRWGIIVMSLSCLLHPFKDWKNPRGSSI